MSSENEFDTGDSGANNTELADAGRMKPGSLIIMKEQFPCRVTAFSTAKPGKHGSAKAMITAKDIFTDKQYDETFGTGDMIPRPIVNKIEVTVLSIEEEDGQLTLMNADGSLKEDLFLPNESHLASVKAAIKAGVEKGDKECLVTYQVWGTGMDAREQITAFREKDE